VRELSGNGNQLTILFRAYAEADKEHPSYFVQHIAVPEIEDDAKGDAAIQGAMDFGEGRYHVDWMMRDRSERLCSAMWDSDATLAPKDKAIPLFLKPNEIAQSRTEPFVNDTVARASSEDGGTLNLKLLVNFAPQSQTAASLKPNDLDALVTILKTIERDPHISRVSLVAFNINESRIVYRQDAAEQIDFPALGKALHTVSLGTVAVTRLADKHGDTAFLEDLIEKEVGGGTHPDAVIFAGPKAMLNADVPESDLRRIGEIECPVFYLNYNVDPHAMPWKDSISHAIRVFKGTEYTISRPKDLWFSTTEMLNRIARSKRQRSVAQASLSQGQQPASQER